MKKLILQIIIRMNEIFIKLFLKCNNLMNNLTYKIIMLYLFYLNNDLGCSLIGTHEKIEREISWIEGGNYVDAQRY